MICLSCGNCCGNISPINGCYCPLLKNEGNIYFCSDYKNRPKECKNHSFPANVCPIGKSELKIETNDHISIRLKEIHELFLNKFSVGLF